MNPKVLLLPVLAALLLVAAVASTLASASSPPQRRAIPKTTSASKKPVRKSRHVNPLLVRRLRRTVWRWQSVMGLRRHVSYKAPLHTTRALRYW